MSHDSLQGSTSRFKVDTSDLTGEDGFELVSDFYEIFLSYDEWMQATHLTLGVRSTELRRLDEAIKLAEQMADSITFLEDETRLRFEKGYQIDDLNRIRDGMERDAFRIVLSAFQAWAKSEGDWRNGRRNKNGAATTIFNQLDKLKRKYSSSQHEIELSQAFKHLEELENEQAVQLFQGAKISLRGLDVDHLTNTASQGATYASGAATNLQVLKFIADCFGHGHHVQVLQDPWFARVLEKAIPHLSSQIHFIAANLPVVDVAASVASLAKKLHDIYKITNHHRDVLHIENALPVGDAKTAVAAIKCWQSEYLREQKKQAAMIAGTAALNLTAILVPAGQPIAKFASAAKSIKETMDLLTKIFKEKREAQALEQYLTTVATIDGNIFKISPLVGAYYVLNASLSTISRHIVPFGSPTFQEDTEFLRQSGALFSLLSDSELLISESHFVMHRKDGLPLRKAENMARTTELAIWAGRKKERAKRFCSELRQKFAS